MDYFTVHKHHFPTLNVFKNVFIFISYIKDKPKHLCPKEHKLQNIFLPILLTKFTN